MDRDEKKKSAEELHEELKKARGIILSGFQGITVAQDFQLRRKIAGTGARYKVVKNSLIERAAKGTAVEPIAQKLAGTTSVAFTETDPVALAKALTEYAKENPILTFKCGVVEGRVVSLADLNAHRHLAFHGSNCFPRFCSCSIHRRNGWHRRCRAWLATSPMLFRRP